MAVKSGTEKSRADYPYPSEAQAPISAGAGFSLPHPCK
jgi:hypothetical protein